MNSVLIHNVGKLLTPLSKDKDNPARPLFEQNDAAVWIENGTIKGIGRTADMLGAVPKSVERYDANGKLMVPGFVDCHAHPVYVGNRAGEFFQRNRGASYQEIAESGGGIQSTAQKVARASVEQIVSESLPRFEQSLAGGVTTIECKSGYGLTWSGEEKLLVALREIEKIIPQRMAKTLLVHAVPSDYHSRRSEYIETVIEQMIPETKERGLASCVDIFCEDGAFSVAESQIVLSNARNCGLDVTIHANQFGHSGGARLAAELGTRSADHLEYLDSDEIAALRAGKVPAVCLPACVFFMNAIPFPPMRQMIDDGLRVALATDMNPGTAMTESIPFCMTAAAIYGKLSAAELLWAVTYDPARILGLDHVVGSIENGRDADFSLWNVPQLESLAYHFGSQLADEVWVKGQQVIAQDSPVLRY